MFLECIYIYVSHNLDILDVYMHKSYTIPKIFFGTQNLLTTNLCCKIDSAYAPIYLPKKNEFNKTPQRKLEFSGDDSIFFFFFGGGGVFFSPFCGRLVSPLGMFFFLIEVKALGEPCRQVSLWSCPGGTTTENRQSCDPPWNQHSAWKLI